MFERNHHLARRMALTARIIGLVIAIFMVVIVIGSTAGVIINDKPTPFDVEGVTLGIIILAALVGCIMSFWWERLTGTLLVLAAIGLAIHIGICTGSNHILA